MPEEIHNRAPLLLHLEAAEGTFVNAEAVHLVGLKNQKALKQKVFDTFPVILKERRDPQMVSIVPMIDRDIMFGGYIGLIEFTRRFLEHGLISK